LIITIDKHSGMPLFRQILDQIREMIVVGLLKPGEALKSVSELSTDLSVNPMTISKVYSLLENLGYVERKRGVGMFVKVQAETKAAESKIELFKDKLSPVLIQAIQMGMSDSEISKIVLEKYKELKQEGESHE